MRVCLISREYPPETGWGGIATFAYHLAHGLHELGHEVEVVSLAREQSQLFESDGIRVHRVLPYIFPTNLGVVNMCMPYSRNVLMASTALWEKFLELHQQRPFDVVDTPELLAEGLYPAATKVAPLVVRLYTPHSKFIAERLHNVTPSFDHEFVALLERVAMQTADVLTCPSQDLANYVSTDLHCSAEKIRIIRNPIDSEKFHPDCTRAIPPNGTPMVLFVGRLEERKGINYLIDAIPDLVNVFPNVRVVIIGSDTQTGPGQKSVLAQIKRSLHSSGVQDNVTFIDRVALDSLPSYYCSADVCVVPSLYDNSPYTCLEAMACGRAIVGTTSGGTPEYIVDGQSGKLVPPRDKLALGKAIIELLGNEQERLRLGQNARQRVLEQFQRTEIARQTIGIYQEAMNNFALQPRTQLYLKSPALARPDAEALLEAFNHTIGNFLYLHSWRFRLTHWFQLRKRPKLFAAKLFMRIAQVALKLLGKTTTPESIARLQADIDFKQDALRSRDSSHSQHKTKVG